MYMFYYKSSQHQCSLLCNGLWNGIPHEHFQVICVNVSIFLLQFIMCFTVLSGIYANICLFHSYFEVNVATRSSPYPDQMVDQDLEMTLTALNVSGDHVN